MLFEYPVFKKKRSFLQNHKIKHRQHLRSFFFMNLFSVSVFIFYLLLNHTLKEIIFGFDNRFQKNYKLK